jgi:hypothetical protein
MTQQTPPLDNCFAGQAEAAQLNRATAALTEHGYRVHVVDTSNGPTSSGPSQASHYGTGWVSRLPLLEGTRSGWTTRTAATTGCFRSPTNRPQSQR